MEINLAKKAQGNKHVIAGNTAPLQNKNGQNFPDLMREETREEGRNLTQDPTGHAKAVGVYGQSSGKSFKSYKQA